MVLQDGNRYHQINLRPVEVLDYDLSRSRVSSWENST